MLEVLKEYLLEKPELYLEEMAVNKDLYRVIGRI
jgi:hypothetical protein